MSKGKVPFFDLHLHTPFSLKDGKIRILDSKDPSHIPGELLQNALDRGVGAVTATDHGNMYGQAIISKMAKIFDLKHLPGCEFYYAPKSRFEQDKNFKYSHICSWAKTREGYKNMCIMSNKSFTEGFYNHARIDWDLIDKYGDGIIWSDACVGGIISQLILRGDEKGAYKLFNQFLNRFGENFFIEYQNHNIEIERIVNTVKVDWANKHGVPIIATIDSHFAKKEESDAHKMLLSLQYSKKYVDPTYNGFPGNGYWLLEDDELLERFPREYIDNTLILAKMADDNIIDFDSGTIPSFQVPEWFKP